MVFRIAAAIVGAGLLVLFVGPVVLKLKDPALAAVVLIGLVLMAIDLWQSVRSRR